MPAITSLKPDAGSVTRRAIMGENVANIVETRPEYIEYQIGDTIDIYDDTYVLNKLPEVVKVSSQEYQYTMQFESVSYSLAKIQCMFMNPLNVLLEADFSLMGNAKDFATLVLANANRASAGWVLGDVDTTEYKNLTFSKENCLQVLSRIAEEFDTEFWIEGRTIHLTKRSVASGLTFEYGKGKGIYQLTRNNTENYIITRLYAFGSNKNLPADYRNFSDRLLMPVAAGAHLSNNVDKYGVIEATQIFEDIYPHRTGTVSASGTHLDVTDSGLDFDINAQLIPGTTAKITFNTGQLAGYTFEISKYDHATKKITFNPNKEEKAIEIPSALIRAVVGDKYVLTDIKMPQSYIDAAEAELQAAAQAYLTKNSVPRVRYGLVIDPIDARRKDIRIKLGDTVRVKDTVMGVDKDIRVVSITRDLNDEYTYPTVELAESVAISPIIRQISAQEKAERAIRINRLLDPQRARINWRNQQELLNMAFDPEGDYYTERVKPLLVETTSLIVGASSQQLTLDRVVFQPNYQGNANQIQISAGALTHFAIDPNGVKTWTLSAYTNTALVAGTAYYIYAECLKSGSVGGFLVTTAKITVNDDPDYYHFLLGNLHSVVNGFRNISLTFGSTRINGREINTGRISSQDGLTWFDLDTGQISGKITFGSGSTGYSNLTDRPDLALFANKVTTDAAIADLQNQIDGSISSWFYNPAPTLANVPASTWTTNAIKDEHIGDTYFSYDSEVAYRFLNIGGVYQWQVISDTVSTAALAAASRAQDTADGKRRVFVAQPVTPYEVGDLWTQGAAGDLMRCSVTRLTGSYNAADWGKASKYTDDTAVNNLQIGGRNYFKKSTDVTDLGNSPIIVPLPAINGFRVTGRVGVLCGVRINNVIDSNGDWTVSFWVKNNDVTNGFFLDICDLQTFVVTSGPEYVYNSFTVNVTNHESGYNFVDLSSLDFLQYDFKDIKIEKGNKATDWSPAPEDVDANIASALTLAQSYADSQASVAQANAVSIAAGDAQTKANTAYSAALSASNAYALTIADSKSSEAEIRAASDALTKANTAYNNAVAAATIQYNALTNSLKAMAFQDVVELSKLGTTVIDNGMIKTTLLDAAYIRANIINAGYINSLSLTSKQIQTAASGRRIVINDENKLIFYGSAGNKAIEMIEEEGVCKLKFYNPSGGLVWEAGQNGSINYVDGSQPVKSLVQFAYKIANFATGCAYVAGNPGTNQDTYLIAGGADNGRYFDDFGLDTPAQGYYYGKTLIDGKQPVYQMDNGHMIASGNCTDGMTLIEV